MLWKCCTQYASKVRKLISAPAIYPGLNYGGGNENNGDFLQSIPCIYCYTPCPQPCSRPPPTHASTGDSWTLTGTLGQSLMGSLLFSPGSWCARFCLCPPRVYIPVLCKFWQLYSGVDGDLLQKGLCHTQVCNTQSPWNLEVAIFSKFFSPWKCLLLYCMTEWYLSWI